MNEICKACRYTSAIHKETIEKALYDLKKSNVLLADEQIKMQRLSICSDCKHLDVSGTCMMCGCYVMLRCSILSNKCPKKYWI